jgi:putative endonuclease
MLKNAKMEKPYYVYAIRSSVRHYIYVGLTDNLDRRIAEHNSGYNKTTKPYIPFVLIYSEKVNNRVEARMREKYLKSGVGKAFLKSFL